jgi:hypothetical protein
MILSAEARCPSLSDHHPAHNIADSPHRDASRVMSTVDDGSVFSDGVTERLGTEGMRVIEWERALGTRFDLVLSASAHGELFRVQAPLVLLQHGVGYRRNDQHDAGEQAIDRAEQAARGEGSSPLPRRGRAASPGLTCTNATAHASSVPSLRVSGRLPGAGRVSASEAIAGIGPLPLTSGLRLASYGVSGWLVRGNSARWSVGSLRCS